MRSILQSGAVLVALAAPGFAQIHSYECDLLPELDGWTPQSFCDPEQWIDDGVLVQDVDFCLDHDPVVGERFSYTRSLSEFADVSTFFYEARMYAEGSSDQIGGIGPANFSLGSQGGVNYRFVVAEDLARLDRDVLLPWAFAELEPGIMHVHRVELFGDELYVWYVDGLIEDSGIPEGAFPAVLNPATTMGARAVDTENMVWWDYLRWGQLPLDAIGDYDTSGAIDLTDWYFVHDCLTKNGLGIYGGPGMPCPDGDETCQAIGETTTAGPGCTFADFDGDNDVDLHDVATFHNMFGGTP